MLKLLKGIPEINGQEVVTSDESPKSDALEVDWQDFERKVAEAPIFIDFERGKITYRISELGIDTRQGYADELIATALILIESLRTCEGNFHSALKLKEALMWQENVAKQVALAAPALKKALEQAEKDKEADLLKEKELEEHFDNLEEVQTEMDLPVEE